MVRSKAIQRWRGSAGNVRLSHLLLSFLFHTPSAFDAPVGILPRP